MRLRFIVLLQYYISDKIVTQLIINRLSGIYTKNY